MAYVVLGGQGAVSHDGDGTHQIAGPCNMSGTLTVSNFPHAVSVITASSAQTFSYGGVYILSSSTGAVTVTVPDPGRVPGAKFVFRNGSAHAHLITGSVAGFASFIKAPGITATGILGSRCALENLQNSSVVLESDGFHYIISAGSGTCTLAQL
jgi:hypothetical protein